MATIPIGSSVLITNNSTVEDKLFEVGDWLVYLNVNGTRGASPIASIKPTITDPETDEGDRVFSVSYIATAPEDLSIDDVAKWDFVPSGTESDFAGTLDWSSGEYTVVESVVSYLMMSSNSLSLGFMF